MTLALPRLMKMAVSKSKKVVIVGAGWSGLAAAKTYLEVDSKIDLTIIEAQDSIGGVWSAERIYPGLNSDSPVGLFDFSDLPMRDVSGLKDWSDLPGTDVHSYLKAYAERFHLAERIRLRARISSISRNEDGQRWDLLIKDSGEKVTADKLILATGINSQPNWPKIPLDNFSGPVIHSKDLGTHHREITSPEVERVTVYGGCKSAVDTISLCLAAGKKVDWVIRRSGNGPGMMFNPRLRFGMHAGQLAGRWKNILTPSIFAASGFWYRFLHSNKSWLGTWICSNLWMKANTAPYKADPYKTGATNVEKIYPETMDSLFFTASVVVVDTQSEFIKQLISGESITVHRATITSISGSTVSLSDGKSLESQAVVFATGWNYETSIFDPSLALRLGISTTLQEEDPKTERYWKDLHDAADRDVTEALPVLKHPPPFNHPNITHTPPRLYRHIVPSSLAAENDRSLIFLGLVTNTQTAMYSEVSALWGIAYMEGLLDSTHEIPSKADMDWDIARVNAWCARRYLSRGSTRQIASAEIQDVIDLLMVDLGLNVRRKPGWFGLKDVFAPYRSQDYKGIVAEVLGRERSLIAGK